MASPSPDPAAEPASEPTGPAPVAHFGVPAAGLIAAIFLALCLSPIAFLGGAWFALFLLPLAVVVLVLRVRTRVDADGLHVRTLTTATLPWSQVATLRLADRAWVRAVPVEGVRGGRELVLINVRVHDLDRVGEASGGRIRVPGPAEVEAAEDRRRELEAARIRVARLREATGADEDAGADETAGTAAAAPAEDAPRT